MSEPHDFPVPRKFDGTGLIASSLFVGLLLILLATYQDLSARKVLPSHTQARLQPTQHPWESALTSAPARVIFTGRLQKRKVSNPKVVGGMNLLLNESGEEYRLVSLTYHMDRSRAKSGESIESDFGVAIIGAGRKVSLTSGEEMLVVHDYYVPGSPTDGAKQSDDEAKRLKIPAGGFPVAHGQRLSIGGVSALVPLGQGGVTELDQGRLDDGGFMAVKFRAELVRADLISRPAVTSYRSPYRDRNYVADPSRLYAPHTEYRNVSRQPVNVHGVGVFLSNLTSTLPTVHALEIAVNGRKVADLPMPAHLPGKSSQPLPLMLPLPLQLLPGQRLSVRGRVESRQTLVFDFAAYVIAGFGLEQTSEQLELAQPDINGDGYNDIVDRDGNGSLWVSIRVGEGYQETQDEKLRHLPPVDELECRDLNGDGIPDLLVRNKTGFGQRLIYDPKTSKYLRSYLTDPLPNPGLEVVWGDFNGDGFPDRLRVDHEKLQYLVALGGIRGLAPETPWLSGMGKVEKMFASDNDEDGKTDLLLQWAEQDGLKTVILKSDGSKLIPGNIQMVVAAPTLRQDASRATSKAGLQLGTTATATPQSGSPGRF